MANFATGTVVRIAGLSKRPELNGERGSILGPMQDGRHPVLVLSERLLVRTHNLSLDTDDSAEVVDDATHTKDAAAAALGSNGLRNLPPVLQAAPLPGYPNDASPSAREPKATPSADAASAAPSSSAAEKPPVNDSSPDETDAAAPAAVSPSKRKKQRAKRNAGKASCASAEAASAGSRERAAEQLVAAAHDGGAGTAVMTSEQAGVAALAAPTARIGDLLERKRALITKAEQQQLSLKDISDYHLVSH